jgi:hypothetical protein
VTEARNDIPSVVERTRPVKAGAGVVGAHFLGDTAVLVLGEEALILAPRAGEPRTVAAHDGAILCSSADADRIVTGGDDGKVVATGADGERSVIATDAKGRWIDHVAAGPNGVVAWSAGKHAFARTAKGAEHALEVRSTVGGLAFAPKGIRGRALQRHHALVPERAERSRHARMEGLPSRRRLQPRRQVRGHLHAGADAARLAAR